MNAAAGSAPAGYLTDVAYTSGFFRQQAPAWLAYIATINGYAAPALDAPFTYCELGCGRGLTSVILAATHPAGEFHATDLMPGHIAHAERLAKAGGVQNLTLYASAVGEFLHADLPQFDFITLHGLWSWVPEEVRGQIVRFLRERLKPGGLAMLSYNALPGWATLQPVREMMQAYAGWVEGGSVEKARGALEQLIFLAQNGAGYFAQNPPAKEQIARLLEADPAYVAHEYLTPHGDPFYFSQVHARMRAADLAYAGSMLPEQNYALLALPEAFAELLRAAPSRAVFETHRDFIENTRFRYDLYAAQPPAQALPAPLAEHYRGLRFAIQAPPEAIALKGALRGVEFDLEGAAERVRRVLARLELGPAGAGELHAECAAPGEAVVETLRLLQQLVLAGAILPCPESAAAAGHCSALNAELLGVALEERGTEAWLACPGVAMGYPFPIPFALALREAARCESAGEAASAALAAIEGAGIAGTLPGALQNAPAQEARAYFERAWVALRDPASGDARLARIMGLQA